MAQLEVHNLKKIYTTRFGGNQVQALSDVSFDRGIRGVCGRYGRVRLRKDDASQHSGGPGPAHLRPGPSERPGLSPPSPRADLAAFRRENLGFVFQDFNLLDTFSLQDNILLPLVLAGVPYGQMQKRLQPLAAQLGLDGASEEVPLRGLRRSEAAGRCGPGSHHPSPADPGRRAHRRPGLPRL